MADKQQRQMPERIYISNEKGTPNDTAIYDAETGEVVQGVLEVTINHNTIEAAVTPHWPPQWDTDAEVNNPTGDAIGGVNVERHRYQLKRLEAESW